MKVQIHMHMYLDMHLGQHALCVCIVLGIVLHAIVRSAVVMLRVVCVVVGSAVLNM